MDKKKLEIKLQRISNNTYSFHEGSFDYNDLGEMGLPVRWKNGSGIVMGDIIERQNKENNVKELWGNVTTDSSSEAIVGLCDKSTNSSQVVWTHNLEIFNGVVSNGP